MLTFVNNVSDGTTCDAGDTKGTFLSVLTSPANQLFQSSRTVVSRVANYWFLHSRTQMEQGPKACSIRPKGLKAGMGSWGAEPAPPHQLRAWGLCKLPSSRVRGGTWSPSGFLIYYVLWIASPSCILGLFVSKTVQHMINYLDHSDL